MGAAGTVMAELQSVAETAVDPGASTVPMIKQHIPHIQTPKTLIIY